MRRPLQVIVWIMFTIFGLFSSAQAELQIEVPAVSGVISSIVTLDCIVKCDELDAANFYLCFDPKELEFYGPFADCTRQTAVESGFDIVTNVLDRRAVNEQGMIGVVMDDRDGNADSAYFAGGVRLFSAQFKILADPTDKQLLQFAGKDQRQTSIMYRQARGIWRAREDSGRISFYSLSLSNNPMTFPKAITEIGEEAFVNCDSVDEIVLPEGLLSIGKRAFADSDSLRKVSMPASVRVIDSSAFENCSSIVLVCVPNTPAQTFAGEQRIPFILGASQSGIIDIVEEE